MSYIRRLDDRLFTSTGWFAIDRDNRRVPRVVVPTLASGLSMLGKHRVAALVGRLRPGFVAVDVDLPEWDGHAATERLARWAETRDLWSLVRASGGADGRHHVIVAVGTDDTHMRALMELVDELRAKHRCARTSLDVRPFLRPLSSPHRSGQHTKPYGHLGALLAACPTFEVPLPSATSKAATPEAPLLPRPRRRRELPEPWALYLEQGIKPTITGGDTTDSTYEAIATASMVRAGWTADEAWQRILTAHPSAMRRARQSHRRWVSWVWNRAVLDNETLTELASPDREVAHSVERARRRLDSIAWTLTPRQRPAVLAVGHVLLDRMDRSQTLRVPCPERDLLLDTGLASRRVVRSALRLLAVCGLGDLHTDTFDPSDPLTSFEFEVPTLPADQWEKYPPSSHTPSPGPGHWQTLPRTAHQVWRALRTTPAHLPELAQLSLLTPAPDTPASTSTLRTLSATLRALHEAGLAYPSPDGRWHPGADPAATPHDHEPRRVLAAQALSRRRIEVATERELYRARSANLWARQRAQSLARNAQREAAWWDGLSPEERRKRRELWRSRFRAAPIEAQHRIKQELAARRQRAGLDERARYEQWLRVTPPAAMQRRSVELAHRFASLSAPEQQLSVALWNLHRATWGLPGPVRRTSTRVDAQPESLSA